MSIAYEIEFYASAPVDGYLPVEVNQGSGGNTARVTFDWHDGKPDTIGPMAKGSDGTFYSGGFRLTLAETRDQDITVELTLPDGCRAEGGSWNGRSLSWSYKNGHSDATLPGPALHHVLNNGGTTIEFRIVDNARRKAFDPGIRVTPA